MAIPVNWQIFYDWGSNGIYFSEGLSFSSDGTWSAGIFKGGWVEVSNEIIFNFTGFATVYAGSVAGNAAAGVMTDFHGATGSWYMTAKVDPRGEPGPDNLAGKRKQ